MWQPDGWGQTRIGLLTPHAHIVPEEEFSALAPDGISIHAARIPFGGYRPGGTMDPTIADDPVRAIADPPAVDDAAEMLAMAHCMQSFSASPAAVMCEARPMMWRSSLVWRLAHEASQWSSHAQRRLLHWLRFPPNRLR